MSNLEEDLPAIENKHAEPADKDVGESVHQRSIGGTGDSGEGVVIDPLLPTDTTVGGLDGEALGDVSDDLGEHIRRDGVRTEDSDDFGPSATKLANVDQPIQERQAK